MKSKNVNLKTLSPSERENFRSIVMEREQIRSDLARMTERAQLAIKQLDAKVSSFLFTMGVDGIEIKADRGLVFSVDPCRISVKRVRPRSLTWDACKLEKLLGREKSRGVVRKKFVIDDTEGFVAALKAAGVKPQDVKEYIRTERTVDTGALDDLDELGGVDRGEIMKCCTVSDRQSYLKYTVRKGLERCEEG